MSAVDMFKKKWKGTEEVAPTATGLKRPGNTCDMSCDECGGGDGGCTHDCPSPTD